MQIECLDDDMNQDKPLEIKVLENGTNELVGIVQIDLNPLILKCLNSRDSESLQGWFPIYTVDAGINGEILLELKLKFEMDENFAKFYLLNTINFFSSKAPPYYEVKQILGFVEESVEFKCAKDETDDQILLQESFQKLRKKLGRAVLSKKKGNALITYRQSIDYEMGRVRRVVLRGYGTAVQLDIDKNQRVTENKKG